MDLAWVSSPMNCRGYSNQGGDKKIMNFKKKDHGNFGWFLGVFYTNFREIVVKIVRKCWETGIADILWENSKKIQGLSQN